MGCGSQEFSSIGLCKFTAAYEVYCEAKGIKDESVNNSSGYNDYLDLRDKLEPIVNRNRERIRQNHEKAKGSR